MSHYKNSEMRNHEITFCLALGHSQWAYGINARPCGCNPTVLINWEFDRRDIVFTSLLIVQLRFS
jgi:hypothetical protein